VFWAFAKLQMINPVQIKTNDSRFIKVLIWVKKSFKIKIKIERRKFKLKPTKELTVLYRGADT